jgi:hypothetical protein
VLRPHLEAGDEPEPRSTPKRRRPPETDLVDARTTAGGHADPAEVLLWLRGEEADPWGGLGSGDDDGDVLEELGRKLQRR